MNEKVNGYERQVVDLVQRPNYSPLKPKQIAKELGVPSDAASQLKRAIKKLVKEGTIHFGPNHLVQPGPHPRALRAAETPEQTGGPEESAADREPKSAGRKAGEVLGVFQRKSGGFGFVRPLGVKRSAGRDQDVYVPFRRTMDAVSGDTVRIKVGKMRRGNVTRVSGEVMEIVERGTNQFVGTYLERDGGGYVRVDGGVFGEHVSVGDPGAKNAQPDDKVVIEIVRFPTHYRAGEGVIVEVLGPRGAPGVDTQMILREFQLPGDFSEETLDDARRQAESFDESITDGRVDLTATTIITIDPVDARDFDDAISLERIENDHWRLGVHIADVSHFVRPGSALDDEARDRATSIYLPDRVIPMLPEVISNNLASLQPDRIRYTKTAFIEFTPDGAVVDSEICSAAIRSARRFSYEEVDDFLARPAQWRERLSADVFGLLDRMFKLAMILRRRRLQRGAIELSLPEVKLKLDNHGRVAGAEQVQNTESHQVIEEFMLAANEAVARKLADSKLLFLRRVHEPPDPRKLKTLTEFVEELGLSCESLESRFEVKRILAEVAGTPVEHAVNYAVLRSFAKAVYGPQEEGHFALASDCYCHFTSPIRRYPDLTVHRLLDSLRRGKPPENDFDRLANLGDHCSHREQRAEQAERELIKLKLLNYLSKKIGMQMEVVVTGVEDFGMFVQGVELPADGLIHVTSLGDDRYHYDARAHMLSGHRPGNQFRLGDLLLAEIARIDLDQRELDFRMVRKLDRSGLAAARAAGGAGGAQKSKAPLRKVGNPARDSTRGSAAPGNGRRGDSPAGAAGKKAKGGAKKNRRGKA